VTSDEGELARLAGLSFSHPNGFDRLVIASDPDSGARLRVHVWWNDDRTTGAGHIHNHPWTFASRILAGRLHVETYHASREHSTPGGGDHLMFGCPGPVESRTSYRWSYVANGPVRLESCAELSLPAGSQYMLDFRVFHRVVADRAGPAVSAVVHESYRQLETKVVVDASVDLTEHVVAKFTCDEFRDRLGRVVELTA
jgi:hypothetical protein